MVFVGFPRFPAPVEFLSAFLACYIHPVILQTACLILEGGEFTGRKREELSGFKRMLGAINNVLRKFSTLQTETGRWDVDGRKIKQQTGSKH